MAPTNLTSYVSIDPEHGVIVTMQIDDLQVTLFSTSIMVLLIRQLLQKITVALSARMSLSAQAITISPQAMSWAASLISVSRQASHMKWSSPCY